MNKSHWIGGQAVLEGVMLRDRSLMAIAYRKQDGSVGVYTEKLSPLAKRFPFLGWPVLRGIVSFFESLILGVRALNISAARALEEDGEELQGWHTALMVILGVGLGVGLFFILPTFITPLLPSSWPPVALNLAEGILRLCIFLIYLYLITRWSEMQRFFQYHGAEHKVIFCHEDHKALELENIRPYSPRHPRCGTSFILIVMLVSIVLFSLFGWPSFWQRLVLRLSLLPLVAGLSYEAIRFTAGSNSFPARTIAVPGIWLQKMTTREPDDEQLQVAVCALKALTMQERASDPVLEVKSNVGKA